MPTSEEVTPDVLTYQSIVDSANEIFVSFLERIPYFVASIIVVLVFWFLSIAFKKVVYKILGRRRRHQNLVQSLSASGWGAHYLYWHYDSHGHYSTIYACQVDRCTWYRFSCYWFCLEKIFFKTCCLVSCYLFQSRFVSAIR